jgi:hypothetical protein
MRRDLEADFRNQEALLLRLIAEHEHSKVARYLDALLVLAFTRAWMPMFQRPSRHVQSTVKRPEQIPSNLNTQDG